MTDDRLTEVVDEIMGVFEEPGQYRADQARAVERILAARRAAEDGLRAEIEALECSQGIHGWRQATPNSLCPWCEWEQLEQAVGALADEWERECDADARTVEAAELRALLAAHSAPSEDEKKAVLNERNRRMACHGHWAQCGAGCAAHSARKDRR